MLLHRGRSNRLLQSTKQLSILIYGPRLLVKIWISMVYTTSTRTQDTILNFPGFCISGLNRYVAYLSSSLPSCCNSRWCLDRGMLLIRKADDHHVLDYHSSQTSVRGTQGHAGFVGIKRLHAAPMTHTHTENNPKP